MPKYIKLFEDYDDDFTRAQAQLAELDGLRDFAIISAEEYANQSSSLIKVIAAHNRKIIKQVNQAHKMYSDEWYAALAKYPSLSWLVDLKELPEYSEFLAAGLRPVSSIVQLGNRTMVFVNDPEYKPIDSYAIGLFSLINVVRILNTTRVKSLDRSLTPIQFFKEGMRWVLDNLDLTDPKFRSKKAVATDISSEAKRASFLENIQQILGSYGIHVKLASYGVHVDNSLKNIPIDGLFTGYPTVADIRKLLSKLKRSAAKGGPLEVPLSQWYHITQDMVDTMSRFPNVVWEIGPNQIVVKARDTRNWRIKPAYQKLGNAIVPSFGNVIVPSPLAADDLLRKFEKAGIETINRLEYPADSINLSDYPGLRVDHEVNSSNYPNRNTTT